MPRSIDGFDVVGGLDRRVDWVLLVMAIVDFGSVGVGYLFVVDLLRLLVFDCLMI